MTEYLVTFSIVFQFGAASSCISAAVPAIYGLLEETWEASVLPLNYARSLFLIVLRN